MAIPTGLARGKALLSLVILACALALSGCDGASASSASEVSAARSEPAENAQRVVAISDVVHVSRVLDADTIEIDEPVDGSDVVHLIGVDAPELSHPVYWTQPYGRPAVEFTASRLGVGTEVALEFDVEKTTETGELLAYAWLLDDGILFNELLLREGYARAALSPPNLKYRERLLVAQREAREAEKGLWARPELRHSASGRSSG